VFDGRKMEDSSIEIRNANEEALICTIHPMNDTIQALGHKHKILSRDVLRISTEQAHQIHFYRPGLFGFISPRTRLSTGYGYRIESGNNYLVEISTEMDSQRNLCRVLREITVGLGTRTTGPRNTSSLPQYEQLHSTAYHFGDMLLRPSFRLFASIISLPVIHFDPNLYRNYLQSRHGQHLTVDLNSYQNQTEGEGRDDEYLSQSVIPESELWGIFFDQIYYVGLWAAHSPSFSPSPHQQRKQSSSSYITVDDIELQEPYLYIGLPAVSLLNMIFRSRYDFSHEFAINSLRLIDGRIVTTETCPESYQRMFQLLIETKREMLRLEPSLCVEEMDWLRETMLYAAAEKEFQGWLYLITLSHSHRTHSRRGSWSTTRPTTAFASSLLNCWWNCFAAHTTTVLQRQLFSCVGASSKRPPRHCWDGSCL
jgi:hypothetical protein